MKLTLKELNQIRIVIEMDEDSNTMDGDAKTDKTRSKYNTSILKKIEDERIKLSTKADPLLKMFKTAQSKLK